MSINLKNETAVRLLTELSELTGESLTQAASVAFQERLERLRLEARARQARATASLLDLIAEARAALPAPGPPTKALTDELWGE